MAASGITTNKQMKRVEPKKSHSWWWDSHISPKNSKWLAENLEEMDQNVKRMLKLIEDDGDSFAKKAEMYYQKRPELVSLVEEFYRMYRSLAERYDNVTGELRKNIPSELQSQGSGISDVGSEPPSFWPTPKKVGRRISANRAAGFDVFLGSGGNGSDACQKEGDESSTLTDSEEESDCSSVNNYSIFSGNGSDNGLNRKILDLEIELREVKEKLWMQEEENSEVSSGGPRNENIEAIHGKINGHEEELRIVNEKLRLSREEITKLKTELEKYRSSEASSLHASGSLTPSEDDIQTGGSVPKISESLEELELLETDGKIKSLKEELRITKQKLADSEKQVASLKFEGDKFSERIQKVQDQLDLARKDATAWKTKFNSEKRESTKLQERLMRLKSSLTDRDHEVRDLKTAVSDAEQKIFPEKAQIKSQMSKLLEERSSLESQVRELESRVRLLEDEIRTINTVKREKEETFKGELELLKIDIREREATIKDLKITADALKLETENLNAEVSALKEDLNTRDHQIQELDNELKQLHLEQAQLIAETEELKSRAKKLEEEVERQKTEIIEGAEEKREAIRQLCLSIEHYRDGYYMLRQAFRGHKRIPVLA
ncbi:protein NETWORKED 4A [Neltuma alba]|uniref:protein NETWORKED 4A n=1 Tax=Neltuma alba TaxID=207710 RepID=UPI0010A4DDD5|nr:protein NETWORKED 4A-like [Prosopis alba]